MINEISCCGVREYEGIQMNVPHSVMYDIGREMFDDGEDFKFVIFTDNVEYNFKDIKKLIEYVKENKLGTWTKTPVRMNPNSGNKIMVAILSVNITNLKKWYDKQ